MKLTRNIFVTLSSRAMIILFSLVSSVVLARYLGPEGRGLFALVLLLPELARSFGLLGIDQANGVYAGLEPKNCRVLVWQSLVIAGVVGGGIAVAGIGYLALGAPGFPDLLRGPLWLYAVPLLLLPITIVIEYWQAILRGMNRILMQNVLDIGTRLASLLLVVLFVVGFRLDVAGVVWATALGTAITLVITVVLLRRVGVLGWPAFDLSMWKRTIRFALPAYGGNVAAYLNYRVDEIIIAAMLPAEQLGFYVMAVGLVERLWILPGAVANALLPHLTNSPQRDPVLSATIARHVMVWVGAGCLLIFVFADLVVRVLYSSAFAPVVAPLRWLLPGIFVLSIAKVVLAEVIAQEKPHYPSLASGLAVVVNIAANFLLVPYMGISGAALASSLSYSLLALMWVWYYLRECGVRWTALVPCTGDILIYTSLWDRHVRRSLEKF